MNRDEQIEEKAFSNVDILANDINQHCPDLAENYCGGMHCVTCLAHALTAKGYRKASEVVDEFVSKIIEMPISCYIPLLGLSTKDEIEEHFNDIMFQVKDAINTVAEELKKKYTEGEG